MHPQALYRTCSNGHNFIAKVDSGASHNCISKSLWNRIKVNSRLTKPNVILTGAGGSKLSLLGFSEITCSIGRFTLVGPKMEITTYQEANIDFIAKSMNRLKSNPIIKTKGRIELSPESIALVEVQAPRDIIGNKKYQLNPKGYLPQGIIPLDLVHSFDKMPRTLFVPILNTSSKYENISKGSFLGTFEPIDEEVSEVQVTSWTDLEGKMQKVHWQLRKKKSYRQVFSMDTVISHKELLLCQKRDRFCRKLVRTAGRHSDFMINHEGLLIKQVSILRNTYRVYIVPQSLLQQVIKIFDDNRGHQGISRTINMMKR